MKFDRLFDRRLQKIFLISDIVIGFCKYYLYKLKKTTIYAIINKYKEE